MAPRERRNMQHTKVVRRSARLSAPTLPLLNSEALPSPSSLGPYVAPPLKSTPPLGHQNFYTSQHQDVIKEEDHEDRLEGRRWKEHMEAQTATAIETEEMRGVRLEQHSACMRTWARRGAKCFRM
ncbi:hypothetical protein M758_UG096700 [Ceratodon purpureus]|nr:hypothetical protein M758_UG096700 [Ceratodon purpureus]